MFGKAIFILLTIAMRATQLVGDTLMRPGVYLIPPSMNSPSVALCADWGVKVNENGSIDLCMNIAPPGDDKLPKSYKCESLGISRVSEDRYRVLEEDSHCMYRMRMYANSVGIDLGKPIEFSYSIGPDESGMAHSLVQIRFHLKWAQQSAPFGSTNFAERSSDRKTSFILFGTVVTILIIFIG